MSVKLHNSTSIGIEIEICVKKDFYMNLFKIQLIMTNLQKFINSQKEKIPLEIFLKKKMKIHQ